MENLAFSLSSRAAGSNCDPLPQLICFTHENDFGPIPSKAVKPWQNARTSTVSSSSEHAQQSQPVGSAGALAAKSTPVDVSSYAVPAPPILLRQKLQRKNVSIKPRVKIDLVALANSSKPRPASAGTSGPSAAAGVARPASAHSGSNYRPNSAMQRVPHIKLPARVWPPATSLKMSQRKRGPGAPAARHARPWDDTPARAAASAKENSKPLAATTIFRDNVRQKASMHAAAGAVSSGALFHVVRQGQQLSTSSTDPHVDLDAVLGATRHEQYMTQQQQLLVQQQGCLLEQQQALLNQLRQEQQKHQEASEAQLQQQLQLQLQLQQQQQLHQLHQFQQQQQHEQQLQQRAVQQQQTKLLELAEAQNCDARDLSSRLQLHWLQKLVTQQQAQESQQLSAFASSESHATTSTSHGSVEQRRTRRGSCGASGGEGPSTSTAQRELVAPLVGVAKTSLSRCAEGAMASELDHHVQRLIDDLLMEAAADISLSHVSAANARVRGLKMQEELQELQQLEDARDQLRERHVARCALRADLCYVAPQTRDCRAGSCARKSVQVFRASASMLSCCLMSSCVMSPSTRMTRCRGKSCKACFVF